MYKLVNQNPDCAPHDYYRQFSILAKTRLQFLLAALEDIFIKTQKPILCRQAEFVHSLQILQYNQSIGDRHTKFDNYPIKIIHVIYFFFFRWKF